MVINFKEVIFVDDDLKDYTKELLNADIRVFIYDNEKRNTEKTNWLIISKNNNIGYIQKERFIGFGFSTKHKPNRQSGTGYQVETEIINPKIENALNTFCYKPNWALNDNVEIQKYKDIDEYLKQEHVLRYKEIVL